MKRNQICDKLLSAGHTATRLVATLLEGKKRDLLGPHRGSGVDADFLSALQRGGGKPDTTYAAIIAAPLSRDPGVRVCRSRAPWLSGFDQDTAVCKTLRDEEGLLEQRG